MPTKSSESKKRGPSSSTGSRSTSRRASSGRGSSSQHEDRDQEHEYGRENMRYDQWNRPSRSESEYGGSYGRESYQGQRGGRFEEDSIREPYQDERRRGGRSQNNYEDYDENMGREGRRGSQGSQSYQQGRGSDMRRGGSQMNEDIGGMRSRGYQDWEDDDTEDYQNALRRGSHRDEDMDEDDFDQPRRRQSRNQQSSRH